MDAGSGSREGVLLSHEQFVYFQLSVGCPLSQVSWGSQEPVSGESASHGRSGNQSFRHNQIGMGLAKLREQDVGLDSRTGQGIVFLRQKSQ